MRGIGFLLAAIGLAAIPATGREPPSIAPDQAESPWREIAWPIPRDAWPAGRAFRCTAPACGDDTIVLIRPKLGFCNCTTGVADDDEVDRVTDLDLLSDDFVPLGAGEPVVLAGLSGRLRRYRLRFAGGGERPVVGIALSRGCDLLVAASYGSRATAPGIEQAIRGLVDTTGFFDPLRRPPP
jgi:hypothetical protein